MRPDYVVSSCTGPLRWVTPIKSCIRRIEGDGARADFWQRFLAVHSFIFQLNLSKFSEHSSSSLNLLSKHLSSTLEKQKHSLELALQERKEAERLAQTSDRLANSWNFLVTSAQPLLRLGQHASRLAETVYGILELAIEEEANEAQKSQNANHDSWNDGWNKMWNREVKPAKRSTLNVLLTDLAARNVSWSTAIWHMTFVMPIALAVLPRLICLFLCSLNRQHLSKWMRMIMIAFTGVFLYVGAGSITQCVASSFIAWPVSVIISIFLECLPRQALGRTRGSHPNYGYNAD